MIAIDEYVDFITTHKLTPTQYLLVHLLKDGRGDLIQKYKTAFPLEEGTMIPKAEIKDLVDKQFLIKVDKKFRLSRTLLDMFVTPEKAVDEIYDVYPAFVEINDVSVPLNGMDKNVFKEIYIPKIKGSVQEHREVIKDIEYAISHNLIKQGINKFLTSEQWKSFRVLREHETKTAIPKTDDDF